METPESRDETVTAPQTEGSDSSGSDTACESESVAPPNEHVAGTMRHLSWTDFRRAHGSLQTSESWWTSHASESEADVRDMQCE